MIFATIPLTLFIGAILFFFYACVVSTQTWYFDDEGNQVTADGKKIPYIDIRSEKYNDDRYDVAAGTLARDMDVYRWDTHES